MRPRSYILIGGSCLLLGWITALSGVIDVMEPSLVLGFISFALIIVGTLVGFYGAWLAYRSQRRF